MDFSRVVDGFKADVMGRVLQDGLGSVQTGPAGGRQSQGQVLLGSARFWSAQPVCPSVTCLSAGEETVSGLRVQRPSQS